MSGQCCEIKQLSARLVAGCVTEALDQGRLGSCPHAGYHHNTDTIHNTKFIYIVRNTNSITLAMNSYLPLMLGTITTTMVSEVLDELMQGQL